jgi:hypothetical protein
MRSVIFDVHLLCRPPAAGRAMEEILLHESLAFYPADRARQYVPPQIASSDAGGTRRYAR